MRLPKRSFNFLQRNAKFRIVPKRLFAFYNEIQNFENYTETFFLPLDFLYNVKLGTLKTSMHSFLCSFLDLQTACAEQLVY